jgi:DNA mismatch repair ATPase MutL
LQQISQSVPPPEKPSPHTARKKIKTQKLKKRTENTHQTKSKKEETTPRRTRKRKKTEEQERRRRQKNKKEEADRRTRKKNKKPRKKHKKEAQNNIQHKTKPNHEKQHVQASKVKITKQFHYLSIIPAAVFQTKNIYLAERKTPTYTSTARKVQYTRSFSNSLPRC